MKNNNDIVIYNVRVVDSHGIQDSTFETAPKNTMMLCGAGKLPDINIMRDYGNIISDFKRATGIVGNMLRPRTFGYS